MILVLFLTVGGLALAVQSFGRYDTLLLEQSDSQLYGLARSVDRSVSGALEQFIGELDYLIRLENFTDAEADCLAGQPEELLQLLQNNPLIREALITDFLCLQDGRVLLSASGRTGYTFPVGGSLDGRDRVRPCVAENGFAPALPESKVDLIYLCFPNNPTGAVATREQLQAWVDYAESRGAVILFDSAYEAFISDPSIPHSIFEIEGARRCAIEFRSFSKTAGFTGNRCA